jgi:S-DNA-T family DNA segregation ATPase FtsK/SpoIIIE
LKHRDDLYDDAIEVVIREGRGSVSLLQRALGIGYGRAARLIDFMAEDGIVGEYAGSQAREVLMTLSDWERVKAEGSLETPTDEATPSLRDKKAPTRKDDGAADPEDSEPGPLLRLHGRHPLSTTARADQDDALDEEAEIEDEWEDAEWDESHDDESSEWGEYEDSDASTSR